MKILIADPDDAARGALEARLLSWGYEVVAAAEGAAAWATLEGAGAPQLALLDSGLPGVAPAEVCRRVRERATPYVYVIVLTRDASAADVVSALDAGADELLERPVGEHELKIRLRAGRRILDLQRALLDAQLAYQFEARHDALTGALNRAAIVELLKQELARAIRESGSVGVVLADLDRFKAVNETHGHAAGDAVLREAVRRMGGVVRAYDAIGRYGAEEFLIVLPGCDLARTRTMAERFRACVKAQPVALPGGEVGVTLSSGIGAGGGPAGLGAEAVIAAANAALARAAQAGGDRVEPALEDMPREARAVR